MKLRIEIDMNGSAFVDSPEELRRILEAVAIQVEGATLPQAYHVRDINGNRVAEWRLDND